MWWAAYLCGRGGSWSQPRFYGKPIGKVPTITLPAYQALEDALKHANYSARDVWSYSCRNIAGSRNYSLHSYGIAIDIDPVYNPFTYGDPFSGKVKPVHVNAVESIKNPWGETMWSWGGRWPGRKDRMHFQLNVSPSHCVVDWKTVPGNIPPPRPEPVMATYRGVINIPDPDLSWARGVIDRRIDSGLIITTDDHVDDWSRDGRLWTFLDRGLRGLEVRVTKLEAAK